MEVMEQVLKCLEVHEWKHMLVAKNIDYKTQTEPLNK